MQPVVEIPIFRAGDLVVYIDRVYVVMFMRPGLTYDIARPGEGLAAVNGFNLSLATALDMMGEICTK